MITLDKKWSVPKFLTYKEAYIKAKNILKENEVEDYSFDAFLIFEHCFKISRKDFPLYYSRNLPEKLCYSFFNLIERRKNREPLQYILGCWEFMGRKYFVGEGVLTPRDDTEVLVRKSIEFLKCIGANRKKVRILDLCSGAGIVAISLAKKFENSEVLAIELHNKALKYLEKNIELNKVNNVKILKWDVLFQNLPENISNDFDLIVSNPPYIKSDEIKNLQEEVKKEPVSALDGGADGLNFYRAILKNWKFFLREGGALCVEIGFDQAYDVVELFKKNGFKNIEIIRDLSNLDRVVFGTN